MIWTVFRRVVLGTVVEALVREGVAVDLPTVEIAFDDDSAFRVPRLDNYMRFKGTFQAAVPAALDAATLERVAEHLRRTWPELLGAIELPVGDKLTAEHGRVHVETEARPDGRAGLRVRFDLAAD